MFVLSLSNIYGAGSWSNCGLIEGGNVVSFAINPQNSQIMFAGTDTGRIYKSTDSGTSWKQEHDDFTLYSILALAIDPQNPEILYAGTEGDAVFRSTDAGASWNLANGGLTSLSINLLAIDPLNPETIYAGAFYPLYKSTNSGQSWSGISNGLPFSRKRALAIDPQNPASVYVATEENGLFKSTDGGENWSAINNGLTVTKTTALAINPHDTAILYAGTDSDGTYPTAGVFKTTDGGENWIDVTNGISAYEFNAIAIDPQNPEILYVDGYGEVFKSTNGGESWSSSWLQDTSIYTLVIDPQNPASIYAGVGGGVYKSSDNGENWSASNSGLIGTLIRNLALNPQSPGILFAATNSGIYKSTDSCSSWIKTDSMYVSRLSISAVVINPQNPQIMYTSLSSNLPSLFKSIDGGATWITQNSGIYEGISSLAIDPQNTTTIYAGSGTGRSFYKSTNAGESWSSVTLADSNIRSIIFDPENTETIYVGSIFGGVYKSTDAGESWDFKGLDDTFLLALAIDNQSTSTLYSGTFEGVLKSTDSGETWNFMNSGLISTDILSLAIDPQNPSTLYSGTRSSGIFKSTNGGQNWSTFNAGLSDIYILALAIDKTDPQKVFAGTYEGRVWVYSSESTSSITVTTNPAGRSFSVDGTTYSSAQTFEWEQGSSHTMSVESPQGSDGTRYVFSNWSDGGAVSHSITVPTSANTYTANFTTQYQLTTSVAPQDSGIINVDPTADDGFYTSGTVVQLTANPGDGYSFFRWSEDLTGSGNPQNVTMSAPRGVTASFLPEGSLVNFDLSTGGAASFNTAGTGEITQVGYAGLTVNSGENPYGTAVFSYRQNDVTVTEAGVPASPPTTDARIFIDYRSDFDAVPGRIEAGTIDVNTGIVAVNYGSLTANITYTLRDINGSQITSGSEILAAGNHFARFIDQFNGIAAGFDLPADFPSAIQFASLEISSDQLLSIVALRMTTNQRNEILFTTTPVADLTQPLITDPVYFAQFADGGGYTSSIVLLNTSGNTETGMLEILDNDGNPLVVNQVGGTADSSFSYSMNPGGAFLLRTDGFPAVANVGWVRLIPDPGTSTPAGSGVFGYNPVDVLVSESGVPAALPTTHARVYVDLSRNHNTGLAIANLESTTASISINAYQKDGVTETGTSQGPLILAGNGHDAQFANQLFSDLPSDFTGVLDISSPTPFAALTIRSLDNERNEFLMTTFPVADVTRPAPSPIVFPQIADGDGYITEFILISPTGASSSVLSLFDNSGNPLELGD